MAGILYATDIMMREISLHLVQVICVVASPSHTGMLYLSVAQFKAKRQFVFVRQ
jgi:hypothetical protein